MATVNDDILAVLRSIDATLKSMSRAAPVGPAQKAIAPDSDLDSQWGDEEIKFNPRDWSGQSCKGLKMSQCPAEFLEELAKVCDYFAVKNEGVKTDSGKPKSDYDKRTAARARGWARRVRDGKVPVAAAAGPDSEWPDAGF
jgi:hypothetical protein